MAFKHFPLLALSFSLFLSLSMAASHSHHKNYKSSPEAICDSSAINPSYCKRVFANETGNDIYDYCRISFRKSLSQSRKFVNLVDSYLQSSSSLSQPTVRALQDCQFLSQLNLEYFLNTYPAVNQSIGSLPLSEAEDAQTLLSAILTNQQTCLEGLQTTASDSTVKNQLSTPLSNDTDLHTVTLDLFVKAWIPDNTTKSSSSSPKDHGKHKGFSNGRLPMKMSKGASDVYESAKGRSRKLLQTDNDNDSVVISDIVVVSKDGSGNFTAINDAIAAAPNNTAASDGYFLVYITEGVYQEYVTIPKNKKHLMLLGDGINRTIITGSHSVVNGWTTFNSATFAVVAQGFVGVNITFRNTAGASKHQAVAVRNGADMSTFYSCSFEGFQDTLYTHSLRQVYRECDIYGTVDFIFGNAAVVFQNCNIYPRLPLTGQSNAITAQGRVDPNQNTGISIQKATIKAAGDLTPVVGTVKTYLGRPWKQYSRTVYMQSFMDSLIDASGWKDWNGTFALDTLYYAEYDNRGAGSSTRSRVTWPGYHVIKAKEASQFTVSNFVQGDVWLPQTGVPFLTGLI